jgi:hypothetical protein
MEAFKYVPKHNLAQEWGDDMKEWGDNQNNWFPAWGAAEVSFSCIEHKVYTAIICFRVGGIGLVYIPLANFGSRVGGGARVWNLQQILVPGRVGLV